MRLIAKMKNKEVVLYQIDLKRKWLFRHLENPEHIILNHVYNLQSEELQLKIWSGSDRDENGYYKMYCELTDTAVLELKKINRRMIINHIIKKL